MSTVRAFFQMLFDSKQSNGLQVTKSPIQIKLEKEFVVYYTFLFSGFTAGTFSFNQKTLDLKSVINVMAVVSAFLSDPAVFKSALFPIEQKLVVRFTQDARLPSLKTIREKMDVYKALNLYWPYTYAIDKLYGVLNGVLLESEKELGLNQYHIPEKFVGITEQQYAADYLKLCQTWRDEPLIQPLLLHGEHTHRLQLIAILTAIKLGLINLKPHINSTLEFMQFLALPIMNIGNENYLIWDYLIDRIFVGQCILHLNSLVYLAHPGLNKFKQYFPSETSIACNQHIGFFMDPMYLHSSLMSDSNTFPFLSACLIKGFSKAITTINSIENQLPYQINDKGGIIERSRDAISLETSLNWQVHHYIFSLNDIQLIDSSVVKLYYQSRGYEIDKNPKLYGLQCYQSNNGAVLFFKQHKGFALTKKKTGKIFQANYAELSEKMPSNMTLEEIRQKFKC